MKKIICCLLFVVFVQISFGQDEMNMAEVFPCTPGMSGCYSDYRNPNANFEALRPIEYSRLREIFKEITRDSGIEFNYPQAACQQRTQYLSMLLTKKYNVDHFRVWLFAPVDLDKTSTEHLEIEDKNGLADGMIKWKYHVAPAVKIQDKVYVIDPSLDSEEPLLLENWLEPFSEFKASKYSFISSENYFFNTQFDDSMPSKKLDVISGQFFNYGKYPQDNLLVEKGLAVNDTAMSIYKKYIIPLKTSTTAADKEKLNQFKQVFGNYNTLQSFLTDNPVRNGQFQNFYINHFDVTIEARRIYFERTLFWAKKIDDLLK